MLLALRAIAYIVRAAHPRVPLTTREMYDNVKTETSAPIPIEMFNLGYLSLRHKTKYVIAALFEQCNPTFSVSNYCPTHP